MIRHSAPTPVLDYRPPVPVRRSYAWADYKPVVLLAIALLPLEVGAAMLAHHTTGGMVSVMLLVAVIVLNLLTIPFVLLSPRFAIWSLLTVGLLIVPYQGHLGVRWWRVHREAERTRAWVDAQIAATGTAPASPNGYTSRDRGATRFISYSPGSSMGSEPYYLSYSVGSESTAHSWEPRTGIWFYYPD